MSEIVVIGQGYVGLATAVGFASLGHQVTGIDTNHFKIERLQSGEVPFYEPGLADALKESLTKGSLEFSDSIESINQTTEFAFICVNTPTTDSGEYDLSFFHDAIDSVTKNLQPGSIIVTKSTLPIGTSASISELLKIKGIELASNPEFLSEGNAILDFLSPSRIVIGGSSKIIQQRVMSLYHGIQAPRLTCSLESAETIKLASNAYLAVKLSFVNEVAALCERTGASIAEVTHGMSLDNRIGDKFLKPGPGWGGSCFPKDTSALSFHARSQQVPMYTLEAAIDSNSRTMARIAELVLMKAGGELTGKTVAIWGLAFKANTDDTRSSPAVAIASSLSRMGANIRAFDPKASTQAIEGATYCSTAIEACQGADVLVVLTEWENFREIHPELVLVAMNKNAVVYDARGILDATTWLQYFKCFRFVGE